MRPDERIRRSIEEARLRLPGIPTSHVVHDCVLSKTWERTWQHVGDKVWWAMLYEKFGK